jgi:hypothetical protein
VEALLQFADQGVEFLDHDECPVAGLARDQDALLEEIVE